MLYQRIFKRNKLSFVKLFVVSLSIGFLILLMSNLSNNGPDNSDFDFTDMSPFIETEEESVIPVFVEEKVATPEVRISTDTPPQHHLTLDDPSSQKKESEASDLVTMRTTVKKLNQEQKIYNLEKFPQRSKDSIVIVVQVHRRVRYLMKLIQSLKNTKEISDALLIFSHDYFARDINGLVRNIDFCQVIQIYFPYSEQLYPEEFPGTDPDDCPRNTPRHRAKAIKCKNAEHPDMYGHYREAKFTMTKHHWWWKANHVFHELRSTRDHRGLVLFLEEDHYLSPDFYSILQKAYKVKKSSSECQERGCDIITIGDYKKVDRLQDVGSDVLMIQPWRSTENNMGMAFDTGTWDMLSECNKMFCTYDDYNWDWTLMRISISCLQKPLNVLLVKAPRVFHLGTCGLHHNAGDCDVETVLSQAKSVISNSQSALYPQHLAVHIAKPWITGHVGQPNGGWGDVRDHQLCLGYTESMGK